jgi:S-adenosyl methyltransferase
VSSDEGSADPGEQPEPPVAIDTSKAQLLAVFHPASDILADEIGEAARRVNMRSVNTTTLRSRSEVERFFDGLEFIEPGLVQVHRWRPGYEAPGTGDEVAGYAGLARKR